MHSSNSIHISDSVDGLVLQAQALQLLYRQLSVLAIGPQNVHIVFVKADGLSRQMGFRDKCFEPDLDIEAAAEVGHVPDNIVALLHVPQHEQAELLAQVEYPQQFVAVYTG